MKKYKSWKINRTNENKERRRKLMIIKRGKSPKIRRGNL